MRKAKGILAAAILIAGIICVLYPFVFPGAKPRPYSPRERDKSIFKNYNPDRPGGPDHPNVKDLPSQHISTQ